MITLIRQGDLLARLSADFAGHDLVTVFLRLLSIPDRRVGSVPHSSLIQVGVRPVGELMKTGAVHVDDADGGLPVANVFVIHEPPKEDQHVVRLRPRWLEIPVSRCKRFFFGSAENVYVDFTVLVVRRAVVTFFGIGRSQPDERRRQDHESHPAFYRVLSGRKMYRGRTWHSGSTTVGG